MVLFLICVLCLFKFLRCGILFLFVRYWSEKFVYIVFECDDDEIIKCYDLCDVLYDMIV